MNFSRGVKWGYPFLNLGISNPLQVADRAVVINSCKKAQMFEKSLNIFHLIDFL